MVTIESKVGDISERALERFLLRVRRASRVRGQVHVLIVSNRTMQNLNWRFRGKKQATDVLSFPAMAAVAPNFAGDIVISSDIAGANARTFGHTTADEIKVLILHGVLHLAGHDHESDDGEMALVEQRLRAQFGLKDGLIERANKPIFKRRTNKRTLRRSARRTARSRG